MTEPDEAADEQPSECELCDEAFGTEAEFRGLVWEFHEMDGDVSP